ncbi:HEPN family nuclease [Bradyrhizobium sp. S3.9.1]|uniref:HEPN family nuclease n=1 Tax=Bradyrhizobium sp. S3.9.1 TaxID=3156431 RepID=UPI003396C35B
MTDYAVTVRHFAQRTRKNLEKIEELSKLKPNEYFEVTQLINSAIGLLMFPQQEFFDDIPKKSLAELKKDGWPIPSFEHGQERTQNLRDLVKNMRNSFAHFNIDFASDKGAIKGVYLWNRPRESEPPNWVCYLSISDLREIFGKFARLIERKSQARYSEIGINQVRSEIRRALRG